MLNTETHSYCVTFIHFRHGALYKVLGEIEMRQGAGPRARELFALGLKRDPYCASLYHAAALLEARLGNLEVRHHPIFKTV
jgi:hypothetical protein